MKTFLTYFLACLLACKLQQTCHVKLADADNELLQTLQKRFFENIEKYKQFHNRE